MPLISLDIIPRNSSSKKRSELEKLKIRELKFRRGKIQRQEIESFMDTIYDD
jgi:hypothetical protein